MAAPVVTGKSLAKWISEVMNDPEKTYVKDGKTIPAALVRLVLMHLSPAGEKEVDNIPIGTGYDDARVEGLANRFLGRADSAIEGLQGHQKFIIYAFYEGSGNEPQGYRTFSRNAHLVNDSGDPSTDPPTVEGRLQQRMRHDEAYSQMLITGNANLINAQNRFMELQAARLERATIENMQMFEALRDMSMKEALATHDHKMKEIEATRNARLLEGAIKLAPAILNRVTGTEIVPQASADTAILEAIAGAIDQKDLEKLAPLLTKVPDSVKGLLFARLAELEEQKQARERELQEALEENAPVLANGAAKHELEH